MPGTTRRLQAIMFTDVKGYSAMMAEDEARTIRLVAAHRDLVRDCLARHGGEELRTIRDAFLVVFDSALHATQCALEIQDQMLARNRALPPAEQLVLRIGLHVGDVVTEADGEIAGEAVNLAARVEPLAPPGGICLTDAVAAQVRSRIDRPMTPMPPVALKNIAHPPALFRIVVAPVPVPPRRIPWRSLGLAALLCTVLAGGVALWTARRPPPSPWPEISQDEDAQARFELAADAFRRADPRAESLARLATQAAPEAPLAWLLLARTTLPGEAARALERAVTLVEGRDDETARLVRLSHDASAELEGGVSVHAGSDLVVAWDAWQAANPQDMLGAYLRARLYPVHGTESDFHAQDPDREHFNARELRTFLQAHPDWAQARIDLVDMQAARHDADVPGILEEGIRRCPDCSMLRVRLATWHLGHGQDERAREQLMMALEVDPAAWPARVLLASLALREGNEPERVRPVNTLLGKELPLGQRFHFAQQHGAELFSAGRPDAALALLSPVLPDLVEGGEVDSAIAALTALEFQLLFLREVDEAERRLPELEALMVHPMLNELSRNQFGIILMQLYAIVAGERGDVEALQRILTRLREIPPEKNRSGQIQVAVESAEFQLARITKDRSALARLVELPGCGALVDQAQFRDALGDPSALERFRKATEPGFCSTEPGLLVIAHLHLAEASTDPAERAAHLAAIDAAWPQAEPDHVLTRRIAALRQAPAAP